jgi:hypothetical protein
VTSESFTGEVQYIGRSMNRPNKIELRLDCLNDCHRILAGLPHLIHHTLIMANIHGAFASYYNPGRIPQHFPEHYVESFPFLPTVLSLLIREGTIPERTSNLCFW